MNRGRGRTSGGFERASGSPMSRGRGRGKGGGTSPKSPTSSMFKGSPVGTPLGPNATPGTAPTDVVRPVLPPLYPPAPKIPPGRPIVNTYAKVYLDLQEHYRSNFNVEYVKKQRCAFSVERFTDKYDEPHSIDPKLSVTLDTKRLPKELYVKNVKIVRKKVMTDLEARQKLEELSARDESDKKRTDGEGSDSEEPKTKRRKVETKDDDTATTETQESGDPDEEDVEEVDEELDEGTDYMSNYFDNGEDYLDEDEDALEDGAVF